MKIFFIALTILALLSTTKAHGHHHHHHDHDHDHHHHDHDHDHDHHHHDHDHDHHDHDHQQENQKYATQEYVLQLTDQNTQQAIDQFPLILIKFFAPWCGHCKTMAPVYTQLARNLALSEDGGIQIAEVDCTLHRQACSKFGIRGYPTLKYFIDGEAHQYSGPRTQEAFLEFLRSKPIEVRGVKNESEL